MMMICYCGVLAGYIGGTYLDYATNPWVMLTVPLIFVCLFAFMPETPQYLLRNNRLKEAERSIRFYRNCRSVVVAKNDEDNLQAEFDKFQEIARQNSVAPDVRMVDLIAPRALKAFFVIFCLIFVSQWSGSFIMNNYAATIFEESGSYIDANVAAIVMGVFQVCGNYTASLLMDRVGRRSLHIISSAGCSVSLLVTGVYVYLVRSGVHMSAYSWLPVASLSFFIFICAIGVVPVPFVVMTEVMPAKVRMHCKRSGIIWAKFDNQKDIFVLSQIRKVGVMICTCVSFGLQFSIFMMFPYFLNMLELHGCMGLFAVVTTFGLLFGLFLMKETKGKNLDVLSPDEPIAIDK